MTNTLATRKPKIYTMPATDALGRLFTKENWVAFLRDQYRTISNQDRRSVHTSQSGHSRELDRLRVSIAAAEADEAGQTVKAEVA